MKKITIIALVLSLFSGCVSLNSVSLTSIPPNRNNQIQVEKSKFIFLGFNFDNDFVDTAVDELKQQCPNGKITGVLTKDENVAYFLFFFWKKNLKVTGYCQQLQAKK